jgi:hypothetical protein
MTIKKEEKQFLSTKNKILLLTLFLLIFVSIIIPPNLNTLVIKVGDTYLEWAESYWMTETEFTYGYSINLGANQRARMWIFDEDYYVGVLNKTNHFATIVSPNPNLDPVVMFAGNEEYFEVTGDDRYDIHVKLVSFNYVNNKVNLTIKSTNLPVKNESEQAPTTPAAPRPRGIRTSAADRATDWKPIGIIIGVILLIIVIGFVIGYIIWKRRKGGVIED